MSTAYPFDELGIEQRKHMLGQMKDAFTGRIGLSTASSLQRLPPRLDDAVYRNLFRRWSIAALTEDTANR